MTRKAVARVFTRRWFETLLGGLIVVSATLTVVETTTTTTHAWFAYAVHGISLLFAVELAVRFAVARSRRSFVREYWVDCLSVVPLVSAIPLALGKGVAPTLPPALAAIALLRIFRLLRLAKIARHLALLFPSVMRRGAREMFFASGFVLLAVVFASSALVTFERDQNPGLATFGQAFWFSIYSVVAAEPIPGPPVSVGGNVIAIFVILTGLFAFATVVGTISAVVGDRMRSGDLVMNWEDLRDHLIICGWSPKGDIVVREFLAAFPDSDDPIVVIAEFEHGPPQLSAPAARGRVQFLNDDFTKIEVLERAGVRRAARCILLSDTSAVHKARDADARTVLAALTIERLNPAIYTVAEIGRREHSHHLEMGKVNDYVVAGEHSAFLLAQSAVTRGVMSVFAELLTHERGNRFTRCSLPKKWKDKTFLELLVHVKRQHDALLVAVVDGEHLVINPKEFTFRGGEDVVLIAEREVEL